MAGSPIKKTLRPIYRALPLAIRSRLIGLSRFAGQPQPFSASGATEADKFRAGFPSVLGFLENIKANRFSPSAIIDVGANVGHWSRMASSAFASSRIVMFDGDPDNEASLQNTVRQIGSRSQYFLTLLGPENKDSVKFYKLDPSCGTTGSSVLPELTTFEKKPIALPMVTLDSVLDSAGLQAPLLLKLDVQGFELEVLKGGMRTLRHSEVVIMEASLLPYNDGAPLFADVVAFMNEAGFVVFDFCGQFRRESDHVLFQTDVAFVRRESNLRTARKFWLTEP